jgi:hypothetical protein
VTQAAAAGAAQVMVLEQLLKCIREQEPSDKVVLVSNYTQALDLLQKVPAPLCSGCWERRCCAAPPCRGR